MPRNPDKRLCSATTTGGKPCRKYAMRVSDPPICSTHDGRTRPPGPQDRLEGRACSALTARGELCDQWAILDSIERYGAPLCVAHLPPDDPRQIARRAPAPHERRCSARNLDGTRCARWASPREGARGLCWLHANPQDHGRITHGYFRRIPHFSPAEHAYIRQQAQEGPDLSGELVIMRFKLRDAFVYLGRPDIASTHKYRTATLLFRGATTVGRILRTQKKLGGINWGPESAGNAPQMLDQILKLYPAPPEEDDPRPA